MCARVCGHGPTIREHCSHCKWCSHIGASTRLPWRHVDPPRADPHGHHRPDQAGCPRPDRARGRPRPVHPGGGARDRDEPRRALPLLRRPRRTAHRPAHRRLHGPRPGRRRRRQGCRSGAPPAGRAASVPGSRRPDRRDAAGHRGLPRVGGDQQGALPADLRHPGARVLRPGGRPDGGGQPPDGPGLLHARRAGLGHGRIAPPERRPGPPSSRPARPTCTPSCRPWLPGSRRTSSRRCWPAGPCGTGWSRSRSPARWTGSTRTRRASTPSGWPSGWPGSPAGPPRRPR